MKILGIHDGHNASVALVENGIVTFALQEERPTGIKNFFGFPAQALKVALKERNLTPQAIDRVALSSNFMSEPMNVGAVLAHFGRQGGFLTKLRRKVGGIKFIREKREKMSIDRRMQNLFDCGFTGEQIKRVDHHLCHASAAYYGLARDPKKKFLVLTLDGGGDWLCATVSIAQDGVITRIAETPYGNSLGDIYSRTTFMLGFIPWEHEYKLMGMAPYVGEKYAEQVCNIYKKYIDIDPANPLVFKRNTPEPTNHLLPRLERDLKRCRFDSIAGGLQRFTEDMVAKWVSACVKHTGISDVLGGGGVFMNIKANKTVSELPEVTSFEAFPSCGDESNSIGAAWCLAHQEKESVQPLKNYYLGPNVTDPEVTAALKKLDPEDRLLITPLAHPAQRIAELLLEGKVVACVRGAMEFGARALGNRSLLADPHNPRIVHFINSAIKSRDFWMPFAPVMLAKNSPRYIKNPKGLVSPYMMMGFDSTELGREYSAALHPFDASARAQLLEDGQNPALEEVLKQFEKMSGRGVILNTSFNLHGSPIVYGAEDAIKTLLNSGLTHLVINTTLITKRPVVK